MPIRAPNSRHPSENRLYARGGIVREDSRRQCGGIAGNCRPKCNRKRRTCHRLGSISQDPIGFAAGDVNQYRYVGNGPTNSTDPSGLVVHHPYPLHLGGSNLQTGIDIPSGNHNAAHAYIVQRGYGPGDAGRARWAALSQSKQRALIRGSLKAAGVKSSDIRRLMRDSFEGACPGRSMSRTVGRSSFLRNAIKGAVLTAVITAPYEVYAAQAPKIQAFGERLVLSQHLQWLIGSAPKPKNFPSSFVYHYNGEDYHVYIVRRGPNKQEFIIAYTIRGEDDDAEIYWGVRDDRSCPLTR
jgi:hypothetical protein